MEHILVVSDWSSFATTANSAFLLVFSSLFSIINPIGGALIFYGFTKDFSSLDREKIAARVGFYSLLIMFGALWTGTYILSFFGVSIDALRIGGGTVTIRSKVTAQGQLMVEVEDDGVGMAPERNDVSPVSGLVPRFSGFERASLLGT